MSEPESSQRTLQSDIENLRQSFNVWILSISDNIVCHEKVHATLLAAAKQAWEAMNAVDCNGLLDDFNIPSFCKAQDSLKAAIAKVEQA